MEPDTADTEPASRRPRPDIPTSFPEQSRHLRSTCFDRRSHTALVTEVARHVRPAPYLQRLGGVIVDGIASMYNGLHLRLEKDAGYVRRVGGIEVGA